MPHPPTPIAELNLFRRRVRAHPRRLRRDGRMNRRLVEVRDQRHAEQPSTRIRAISAPRIFKDMQVQTSGKFGGPRHRGHHGGTASSRWSRRSTIPPRRQEAGILSGDMITAPRRRPDSGHDPQPGGRGRCAAAYQTHADPRSPSSGKASTSPFRTSSWFPRRDHHPVGCARTRRGQVGYIRHHLLQ